ncbi:MAG TPA: hypothetical protein VFD32_05965, partial [Dehalococcoidia bacterium]|nr:hypothetical protein [Dehalococcoidia bacterium]
MRRPLAFGLALGSLALISAAGASSQLGAPHARAAQTWSVQVGADLPLGPGPGGPVSGNWFFPNVVTISSGDTVSWTFPSANPHGVAFDNGHTPTVADQGFKPLPSGEIDLTAGLLPVPGPNPPTVFDPAAQLSSGVPTDPPDQRQPFTLTFSTPGVWSYECPVHGSQMSGLVIVQPSGSALSETPDQEKARGQADLAAGMAALEGPPPSPVPPLALPGGSSLTAVTAGAQVARGISVLQFLPGDITVNRGDTIVFTGADPSEIHTVTLTSGAEPPPFLDIRPQPAGPPQIVFPAMVAQPVGGNTYDGTGYLNSGLLFPG